MSLVVIDAVDTEHDGRPTALRVRQLDPPYDEWPLDDDGESLLREVALAEGVVAELTSEDGISLLADVALRASAALLVWRHHGPVVVSTDGPALGRRPGLEGGVEPARQLLDSHGLSDADCMSVCGDRGIPVWYVAAPVPRLAWRGDVALQRIEQRRTAVAARRQAEAQAPARRALRNLADVRRKATETDVYVFPKTVVPFPARVERGAPAGHRSTASDCYEGTLALRISALTPVTTRNRLGDEGAWLVPRIPDYGQLPPTDDGTTPAERPVLLDSQVRRMLREAHEILNGGCVTAFDSDYLPVYREAMGPRPAARLAVVASVTSQEEGQPDAVDVEIFTDPPVWLPTAHVPAPLSRDLATGQVVRVEGLRTAVGMQRVVATEVATFAVAYASAAEVPPGDDTRDLYLLYVKDGTVLDKAPGKTAGSFHYALAKLGARRSVRLSPAVVRAYEWAAHDAADVAAARADKGPELVSSVKGVRVGRRQQVHSQLRPGTVLWADRTPPPEQSPGRVAPALIWRIAGAGTLGERLRQDLCPCAPNADLCPTCQLLGAAGKALGEQARGSWGGYASHVRGGTAVQVAGPPPAVRDIAPMGQPRPGVGQHTLAHDPRRLEGAKERGAVPMAHFGSPVDRERPRMLAGRLVAVVAERTDDRSRPRPHHQEQGNNLTTRAEVWEAGCAWQATLSFSNLTRHQLGGLLAALAPHLLLTGDLVPPGYSSGPGLDPPREPQIVSVVGGGKPFGWGCVTTGIEALSAWRGADRLRAAPASFTAADVSTLVEEYRQDMHRDRSDLVRDVWPDFAASRNRRHVNGDRVSYGPGARWPEQGQHLTAAQEKRFDEPFAAYQASAGSFRGEIRPLAAARDIDQYRPIDYLKGR